MNQWTLTIPAPADWITSNDLTKMNRYRRAELVRAWRAATVNYAIQARLPQGLDRVDLLATVQFYGRPPVRDLDNIRPTVKACVDGLGRSAQRTVKGRVHVAPGYGLFPDDSFRHLGSPRLELGPALTTARPCGPTGILTFTITEVTG